MKAPVATIAPSMFIHWFSGTGNAQQAAQWIKEEAEDAGCATQLLSIPDHIMDPAAPEDPNALLGFCYPTHGFNAPPLVLRYLWRFPRGKNRVFLLNTRAGLKLSKIHVPGLGGLALWMPFLILLLKGYRVMGFRPLDMPSNWISLHPGVKRKVASSIHQHCHQTVMRFTRRVVQGKAVLNGLLWLPIDLAVSPISVAYYFYGRFVIAKTFFASYRCNDCGKCIRECPVGAVIRKDRRPYWKFSCESCMHCMNHCPERAIETAHGFVFLMWWAASALAAFVALNLFQSIAIPSEGLDSGWLYWADRILVMAVRILLIYLAYRLMHYFLRYRWFSYLVTYTSFTRFHFWRRYRASKVK